MKTIKGYNWPYIGIFTYGILFWINVWFNGWWGLFSSTMATIVIGAVIGLWLKLSGRI